MIAIRLPKKQWGKAWRAMVEIAPVTLIAHDPIYVVEPVHLALLVAMGIRFEVIHSRRIPIGRRRRPKSRR